MTCPCYHRDTYVLFVLEKDLLPDDLVEIQSNYTSKSLK